MIGKLLSKIWPYIAIVIMGVAIYLLLKQLSSMQDNVDRLSDNMEQLLDDNNSKILNMTKKEFKNYTSDTLLRLLMDSLKIKYRNIGGVTKHRYDYIYDTTVYLVIDTLEFKTRRFGVKFNDCIGAYGTVTDTTIVFDSIPVHYNATTVYYWKRPHKFWFIRHGKKQYLLNTKNNCTGESRIEEIKIEK